MAHLSWKWTKKKRCVRAKSCWNKKLFEQWPQHKFCFHFLVFVLFLFHTIWFTYSGCTQNDAKATIKFISFIINKKKICQINRNFCLKRFMCEWWALLLMYTACFFRLILSTLMGVISAFRNGCLSAFTFFLDVVRVVADFFSTVQSFGLSKCSVYVKNSQSGAYPTQIVVATFLHLNLSDQSHVNLANESKKKWALFFIFTYLSPHTLFPLVFCPFSQRRNRIHIDLDIESETKYRAFIA